MLSIFERRNMIRFGVDKKYLVRGININNSSFKNFTLKDLLEGFEECDEVTIRIEKIKDQSFSSVIIDGVEK